MQRACINESRVRVADHLPIMQPHSPQLFRQGKLPGPELLLTVLRGNITAKDAENEWAKVEGGRQNGAALQDQWAHAMLLPCRSCILENHGIEVRKPLESFTSATKIADLTWSASSAYNKFIGSRRTSLPPKQHSAERCKQRGSPSLKRTSSAMHALV